MGARYFGASVPRREDPRLLTGAGRYVDDIVPPGLLHAVFVRSPHAHARVVALDPAPARVVAGVVAVFTFQTLERWMRPLPLLGAIPPLLQERVAVTMKQSAQ